MQPEVVVNYVAVVVCTIVLIPVGYLWFGPIFGARWARHMGFEEMEPPSGGEMAKKIGRHTLGSFLIAFVLVHSIAVWQPSAWGVGENQTAWIYGLNGAIWTWIGFFVPMQLTKVAWEDKGWGLVAGCDQRRLRPGAAPDFRDDPGLLDVEKRVGGLTELARPEPGESFSRFYMAYSPRYDSISLAASCGSGTCPSISRSGRCPRMS